MRCYMERVNIECLSNRLDSGDGKLKGYSDHRKPTDVAKEADVALFLPPATAAKIENTQPADGKVVANGIGFIESGQAIGDAARRLPVGALAAIQAEKCGDSMDVRVERHD